MTKQKLIVDTHYLIWDMRGNERFDSVLPTVQSYETELYISSISFWEVGMLVGKGRISLPFSVDQFFKDLVRLRGYKILNITPQIADVVSQYSNDINGDPADRVIAATSMVYKAKLLTADINLRSLKFLDVC